MSERIAIVTGAASGIGKAIATALIQNGDSVVIADIDQEQGRATATEIDGHFVQVDLLQPAACRRLVDETVDRYNRVDILVNNAGFQHIDPDP